MKNKKVLNYIYIVIFISVLYIPTISHIFLKDYIKTKNVEKRVLAEKPNLNINNIESYPKQYDDYYNDHIPYRSFIVNNWRNLHYLIFDESLDDRVIIGKNEKNEPWLFYDYIKINDEMSYIDGRKKVTDEDINKYASGIKEQTKKLKEKNIDLYYIICPNKSTVYSQYLPKNVEPKKDYFLQVYERLKKDGIDNMYYSIDILKEASKKYETYYRTDTHWNGYGAFVYVQDAINKLYNKEIIKEKSIKQTFVDSNTRDLHTFTGISLDIKENSTEVSYENQNVHITRTKVDTDVGYADIIENSDYLIDETIFLIGDSFTTASSEYFISIYKKIIRVQFQYSKYDPKLIDRFGDEADKFIYLIVERTIPERLNIPFVVD